MVVAIMGAATYHGIIDNGVRSRISGVQTNGMVHGLSLLYFRKINAERERQSPEWPGF